MSMFDKYKILHGFPKEGQKIRFLRTTMSWFTNVMDDSKLLIEGKEYTVRKTQLNSSSSHVWLEEFPDINNDGRDQPFFNLASFEWEKPEIDMKDLIGYHFMDLTYLHDTYGWSVLYNGRYTEGSPKLMTELDENEEVTKAWLEYD